MKLLIELKGIRYGVLEDEDVAEMARVIAEVFHHSDPLGTAVGMRREELEDFVLAFGSKAAAEGLTVIARDHSGKMVGAMFTDDFGTPLPNLQNLPESFAPVGAIPERLDEQYQHTQIIVPGSHAHLNMLAVLSDAAGRGIAQTMIRICIENAKNCGYRLAIVEANGPVSQHIFRKPGFQERFTVPYKEFLLKGSPFLPPLNQRSGSC